MRKIATFLFAFIAFLSCSGLSPGSPSSPCYLTSSVVNCFKPVDRTAGGTGVSSTATFPETATSTTSSFALLPAANVFTNAKNDFTSNSSSIEYLTSAGVRVNALSASSIVQIFTSGSSRIARFMGTNDTDSGSNPVVQVDARIVSSTSTAVSVSTRPTFGVSNNGTAQVTVAADGGVTISETTGGSGNVPHGCSRQNTTCNNPATICNHTCSGSGERVMGGGCVRNGGTPSLQESYPSAYNIWRCNYVSAPSTSIQTYAICCVY